MWGFAVIGILPPMSDLFTRDYGLVSRDPAYLNPSC